MPKIKNRVKKIVLPGGAVLLLKENHQVPLLAVWAVFLAGSRQETPANNGINNFIARTLCYGTQTLSSDEIAQKIESWAGTIEGFSGRNTCGLSLEVLSQFQDEALSLFFDVFFHPSFPQEELERERAIILQDIKNDQDNLPLFTGNLFCQSLFKRHPYRLNILGTPNSIKKIARKEIISYWHKYCQPTNLVLSVVGDINTQEIMMKVKNYFKDFRSHSLYFKKVASEKFPAKKVIRSFSIKKEQVHLIYGFLGTNLRANDKYSLRVISAILVGQSGRLFLELRDKKSLVYTVQSTSFEGIERGFFAFYLACSPEKIQEAIDSLEEEIEKLSSKRVDDNELERAKNLLIGHYELDLQKNSAQAAAYAFDEIYGLGYRETDNYPQKILRVRKEDILKIAKNYLNPQRAVLSIVGLFSHQVKTKSQK